MHVCVCVCVCVSPKWMRVRPQIKTVKNIYTYRPTNKKVCLNSVSDIVCCIAEETFFTIGMETNNQ